MMEILSQIKIDKDLLLEFFLTFSRFEFALKASGFAYGDLNEVKPNWDRFAVLLRDRFEKNVNENLLQGCNYILDNPPLKQVLLGEKLGWTTQAKAQGEAEVEFLLRMIRCVRNNLFHGGKYNIELHEDTARSETLLRSSFVILEECLKLSPSVKQRFDGAVI